MKTFTLKVFVNFALTGLLISCSGEKKSVEADEKELTPKYIGEEVEYSTDSTKMIGYIAYDSNNDNQRPGVLVIHEWWGHNEYTRERADMLAELGYVALAIDMYGDGKAATHPDDAQKFMMSVFSNMDEATARFTKALEVLKANPKVDTSNIGVIGYCFGGSVALTMANMGIDMDAVAAFHSGVQLPVMPQEGIKAKVLVCNGAADPFVSNQSVKAYKAAMDSVNADYKYIAYDSAKHAFTSQAADSMGAKFGLPLAYNEEADKKSWEEMKNLFEEVFE